jgi:hypothetical protein
MNLTLSSGNGQWSILVSAIKAYTVIGPLVRLALIRGIGLDGPTGIGLVAAGYGLSLVMLLAFGFLAHSSHEREAARSNFIFAEIAFLWLVVLVVLLPSLASA